MQTACGDACTLGVCKQLVLRAQGMLTADVVAGALFGLAGALLLAHLVPWLAHASRPFLGVRAHPRTCNKACTSACKIH